MEYKVIKMGDNTLYGIKTMDGTLITHLKTKDDYVIRFKCMFPYKGNYDVLTPWMVMVTLTGVVSVTGNVLGGTRLGLPHLPKASKMFDSMLTVYTKGLIKAQIKGDTTVHWMGKLDIMDWALNMLIVKKIISTKYSIHVWSRDGA